jgi:diketogulonate reductase-like aldo/keto reductase
MGRVLKKYPRDSFYLADKMPLQMAKNEQDVKRIFQDQLEKCQVDFFDFYLLHAMDRNRVAWMVDYKAYDFLCAMRREGKIRRLGFSFHDSAEVLDQILSRFEFDFVQVQLNYLDWTVQNARGVYQVLEKHGVPGIVMEPVRGGFLADPPKDAAAVLDEALPGKSYASDALRWVARLDGIKVILSGMSNMAQVIDNVNTFTNEPPMTDAHGGGGSCGRADCAEEGDCLHGLPLLRKVPQGHRDSGDFCAVQPAQGLWRGVPRDADLSDQHCARASRRCLYRLRLLPEPVPAAAENSGAAQSLSCGADHPRRIGFRQTRGRRFSAIKNGIKRQAAGKRRACK